MRLFDSGRAWCSYTSTKQGNTINNKMLLDSKDVLVSAGNMIRVFENEHGVKV